MKRNQSKAAGPSQRQLRAGELVRHALVDVLRTEEIADEALTGVSVTVTEVRMSPDLRHATCFVEPLGAGLGGVQDRRGHRGAEPARQVPARPAGAAHRLKFTPRPALRARRELRGRPPHGHPVQQPVVRRDLEADEDDGSEA
jgi:ribosome-binding factor A